MKKGIRFTLALHRRTGNVMFAGISPTPIPIRPANANPALAEDTNPDWSPDGKRITFEPDLGGSNRDV